MKVYNWIEYKLMLIRFLIRYSFTTDRNEAELIKRINKKVLLFVFSIMVTNPMLIIYSFSSVGILMGSLIGLLLYIQIAVNFQNIVTKIRPYNEGDVLNATQFYFLNGMITKYIAGYYFAIITIVSCLVLYNSFQ